MAYSLNDVLNRSSFLLGETSVPTSETTGRTSFANEIKQTLANMRNWTYEIKTGTAINIVANTGSYTLPTDFKNRTAMANLKILDSNGNATYYAPVEEDKYKTDQLNSLTDTDYWIDGNPKSGYILYLNPTPTVSVTGGILPRYYASETDFVNLADTTPITSLDTMAWWVAAKVLFGYREQAQYQLAMNEYNNALQDLLSTDLKVMPNAPQRILGMREWSGMSNNFKTYF